MRHSSYRSERLAHGKGGVKLRNSCEFRDGASTDEYEFEAELSQLTEEEMTSEERDDELEWLRRQHFENGLSFRAIGGMLDDTHHNTISRAVNEGTMPESLRAEVRKYIEGRPEEVGEETRQNPEPAGDRASPSVGAVDDARKAQPGRRGGRRTLQERIEERERAARRSLLDEIVACETVDQVAGVTARIRARLLAAAYERRQVQTFSGHLPVPLKPYYLHPGSATLDELKTYAVALLLETPVLKELPLDVAVGAARAVLSGEATLLNPPPGVHGDALVLLLTRAQVHYENAGAREVALSAPGRVFACGLSAEELRDGVRIEDRMRRYACEGHWDRPLMIGTRLSDVIPARAHPDEDWLFGSAGWFNEDGVWNPGRAELIARLRHVSSLCDDWGAERAETPWQHRLNEERTDLELTLLGEDYGMTFGADILGDARWPTSTRRGQHTQVRQSRLEAIPRNIRRLRRRGRVGALLLWLPRLPLRALSRLVFVLRRDFAVYVEKEDKPRGRERLRQLLSPFLMRPLYDKENPPEKLPRIRERIMPGLYEPLSEQRWPTKIVSWILYRRHSNLDGSVCSRRDWMVTDPPMTPEYVTPNPVSGHVPSRTYNLRFRTHEFESGHRYPDRESSARGRLGSALGKVGRMVRRSHTA